MHQGQSGKRRFLVLPGRGIAGPAMQASVFRDKATSTLTNVLGDQLHDFESGGGTGFAFGKARSARVEMVDAIAEPDFEVISQRFDDGPAVVAMTDAARLALEAGNPDLRVLPITRYQLPDERSGKRKDGLRPAAHVAAESAVAADGTVFMTDVKDFYLNATPQAGPNGAGVLVGLLDTGIDDTHPALQGQVAASRCLIAGVPATSGGPVDWGAGGAANAGHGTHVAGIIAAAAGHGGPAGVAPEARLISYRIFPDSRSGRSAAENPVIIDSIRAAIDDGCHIINLSIEGRTLREDGVRSAILDAWENGVVCIAAAGNGYGNPVSYPAALQHCVAVTAIGRDGAFPARASFQAHVSDQRSASDPAVFLASFSNFGPQVQFAAPGHAVVSTFPGGEWWFNSGTSMAAPWVTGMLARYLSRNGNILNSAGTAQRSSAMLQMLVARAHVLRLPQSAQEGYGLPG